MPYEFSQEGFPDSFAPDSEKMTEEYGMTWAKAIEREWFEKTSAKGCRYTSRRDEFHQRRLYARGEHSTKLHKRLITGDEAGEAQSYTNYDWRPIQVLPKYVHLMVNQASARLFNVRAEATDKFSTDLRDRHRKNMEDNMYARDMIMSGENLLNVSIAPDTSDLPESKEEIDLYMQLKFKPKIELAAEEAIKYTFDLNNYDYIQTRMLEDLTVLGVACGRHYTDPQKGIILEYRDPSDMVYSFPGDGDFEKVYYYGHVRRIPLTELKRITGDRFSDEDLKDMAASNSEWATYQGYSNERTYREDDLNGIMVDVLDFNFKSHLTRTFKKKYNRNGTGYKMIPKDSDFKKPDPSYKGYDVVSKPTEVWFRGSLVLGTKHIFNYGLCENMVRPEGLLQHTMPEYVMFAHEMYQGRYQSPVNHVIPYVDQMQQIHMKLQQLIAKTRPSGVYFDISGLEEVTMSDGGEKLTPLELIKIYDETGNVFGTSVTDEGDYNHGKMPIQELNNGVVRGVTELIGSYNHYLQLVRDALGIPQGADASMPHPDTLVGVQQQAAFSSSIATRHVLDGVLDITRRLGTATALRTKDIFQYSNLKEAYVQAIGARNMEILEEIKDYALHDFGIFIELKPDLEEKQYLEQNIAIAIERQEIGLDDAIDIREIDNLKLANQLLKLRKRRREAEARAQEQQMIQANAEAQANAAQQASQFKMQEYEAELQMRLQLEKAETEGKIAVIGAEEQAKSRLMEQEFQYNNALQGMQVNAQVKNDRYKEGEKMRRQDRNNTQQSAIKAQGEGGGKPQRFESSEDQISGEIELNEMDPK